MKQFYTHYENWECWQNGLYRPGSNEYLINQSANLLSSPNLFVSEMLKMAESWPNTTRQHLTNKNINRRAFLGRATSCFYCGANIDCVRIAWASLSEQQKLKANEAADKFVFLFEQKYFSKGQLSLFKHKESTDAKEVLR